jgi:hypothetical protein
MVHARVFRGGRILVAAALVVVAVPAGAIAPLPVTAPAAAAAPISVYGAWHCSDDYCTWGTVRSVTEFDSQNHWLIDRDGNGSDTRPSVNVVVLAFVNPLKLLNATTDATTLDGVPRGMTPEIVGYFTSRGVRVMLSIGGITYTAAWDAALAKDARGLGLKAAAVARTLGVGIEIDYEQNSSPNLTGLQSFIDAYRSVHPYDAATGANPAARLTIDLAAGDRWLIALTQKATKDWLRTDAPVLDYANAMVPARQPRSASEAISNWQEHIDGKPKYAPPIPPLAPAKFTGGLYVALGGKPLPECTDFGRSLQNATASFVQSAPTKITGGTTGMLGYMFWAAERPSTRGIGTVPLNTCEGGMGVGATALSIPVPMPGLREH